MSKKVRIGVVGLGNMGSGHANSILGNKVDRCELTAVSDPIPAALAKFPGVKGFSDSKEMLKSGLIDAVIIATPHYDHTQLGIEAFKNGVHVLVEKPISVHKADCEKLIAAYPKNLVFAAMFQARTEPRYVLLRKLIQSGELGQIRRINWTVTDWFRSEAYYASGSWRATWAGEGGGILLNQCPHNLDMIQWLFGMPKMVRSFCHIGKYHDIEVEDDVTSYLEYADGKTMTFIASTGEAPGTDRFEIAGERGRVVVHADHLAFTRNVIPTTEFSRTTKTKFDKPETWEVKIPVHGPAGSHQIIIDNFVKAILDGTELIAPAVEGIHSVELANAMVFSSFQDKSITLPLNSGDYAAFLDEKCKTSRFHQLTAKK
jgi:predicted dehydrogenase